MAAMITMTMHTTISTTILAEISGADVTVMATTEKANTTEVCEA